MVEAQEQGAARWRSMLVSYWDTYLLIDIGPFNIVKVV